VTASVAAFLAVAAIAPAAEAAPSDPPNSPGLSGANGSADTVLIVHAARSHSVRSLLGAGRTEGGSSFAGLAVRHSLDALGAFSVSVPSDEVDATVARLRALPGVARVETPVARHFSGTAATNDPLLPKQAGYLGAVKAPQAWAVQPGSPTVTIAILDSGADVTHPDLKNQIARKYNAVTHSTNVSDAIGHGTFVAGVAAAETDNRVGVAGAGYRSKLDIVKIADSDGGIGIDDEVAGITWAADHGADVINLSLGGSDSSDAEKAAIKYAQDKGVLVVAAAGNEGVTVPEYPAAYPGVIAVGATDTRTMTRATFSNHGSWVTVAAPGVDIYSSVPPKGSELWTATESKTGYAAGDGTSFSTPLVAGEAALLKAEQPDASVAQLRAAIVASAHGFTNLGLGAGQVDFASALQHIVRPTTTPTSVTVTGTVGEVRFTAHSTAARVVFSVDGEPHLPAVAVSGGTAGVDFATWGYANGTHTVHAFDCTAFGECNTADASTTFTLANAVPSISLPYVDDTVTGRFTVAADAAGGSLRLSLDNQVLGYADSSPYTFTLSATDLPAGAHVIAVQGCSRDHKHCFGPKSPDRAITVVALYPTINAISPGRFSPNGDGVLDTARLAFTLPDAEVVQATVLSRGTPIRTVNLHSLAAGPHAWSWNGRDDHGDVVPDGTYTLALDTASVSGPERGWVSRTVVVDTRRPGLAHPSGAGGRVYPYRDGYRDNFTTTTSLGEAGRLTLAVTTARGAAVRTISATHGVGRAQISWNGRDAHNRMIRPGTYHWRLSLTDAAGNTTRSATYRVIVRPERLVTQTRYLTRTARSYRSAGGTADCATARRRDSVYPNGVHLVNRCAALSYDLAYAEYLFRLPSAVRYSAMTFQVRGASTHRPSELTAAFNLVDGSVEIPRYLKVSRAGLSWHSIATVPAAGHVSRSRATRISLLLDSYYRGVNDFDVAQVRLRVRMTVLR
jgi:subtilisin family serine protease/flagellar hook assembly protein FlgD